MSHYAQGWAQRQKLGDPIAKAVLQTMCYVMRDDQLLVYVSVPTLEEFTEYEERSIRKAVERLKELGVIVDTGKKRNNVTVWRIPGYEQWLVAQNQSTPANGRASPTDLAALAQIAELTKEKAAGHGQNFKPPREGEGHKQALPSTSSSPPVQGGQALPYTGPNLNTDLNRSSGARADAGEPSGPAPRAQEPERLDARGKPFDQRISRQVWFNVVYHQIVAGAVADGIAKRGLVRISEMQLYHRAALEPVLCELTEWAIAEERSAFPNFTPLRRRGVEDEIETRVRRELKVLRPKSPAEAQATEEAA